MVDRPDREAIRSVESELASALEREKALRNILEAINGSTKDDASIFDVILQHAQKLCDAPVAALMLAGPDDPFQKVVAQFGASDATVDLYRRGQVPVDPEQSFVARAICSGQTVQVNDLADTENYRKGMVAAATTVDDSQVGTLLAVPLRRDGAVIGAFSLMRKEVRAFTPAQVSLLEIFAAQAVIAIENARQFREVQSRLEREAAAREILQVISQSRDDEMPVFRAILDQAERLCGAWGSGLQLLNDAGTHLRIFASKGGDGGSFPSGTEFCLSEDIGMCLAVRERRVVHFEDLKDTDLYRQGHEGRRKLVDVEGMRTHLNVPLIKDGVAFGNITLGRREQKPFTPDEIALVEGFATQAVIAIENVRQFKALESLNAELGDRVEAQVGEIERMGRLKRFLPSAVVDRVISEGSDKLLASHRALLGVLFCDIRGFTAFCETAEPEETIEVLQTYHEEMGALIAAHGAGVDTRAGDGIMVLFNDPLPCDDPAADALRLGLAMQARMRELCNGWKRHGHKLGFGVGISLGYATVGMVGSEGRYDYTASGTAVNLAARLCDKASDGEILLSPRAYAAVDQSFAADLVGELTLKGIHAPVEVYRVIGPK